MHRSRTRTLLDVVYDGQCRFCRRSLDLLERLAGRTLFRLHDANERDAIQARFPMLADADTDQAMFVVTPRGKVFRGFFAYRRILWESVRLYPLLPLFYAPGAALVGPRTYAWVARHRRQLGCSSASCSIAGERGATAPKGAASVFSLLLLGAILTPVAQNLRPEADRNDSFPFSYYPMFSQNRHGEYVVTYLLGLDQRGDRYPLSHELAGEGGFNQTRRQINRFVRDGKSDVLCRSVARALAEDADEDEPPRPNEKIVTVEVVTGTFRLAQYFGGEKAPAAERVRASCPVDESGRAGGTKP